MRVSDSYGVYSRYSRRGPLKAAAKQSGVWVIYKEIYRQR